MTLDADVIVIGTGFAGIGMAIALKRAGIERFIVLERAHDLGGTWRDNRYPGCACDIPSQLYSFSFARNRDWSRVYPQQDEIWAYLRRCAERFDILPHVRFDCELIEARYDGAADVWSVRTRDATVLTARVLVAGMGGLSNPAIPQLPGLERFAGPSFHSAQWNHEIDLRGKRVAVVGTGASAIQFVPEIAPLVERLAIFQRTAPWIIPRPDAPVTPAQRALRRSVPGLAWLQRKVIYWVHEVRAYGFTVDPRALAQREHLALRFLAHAVPEPELRRALTPDYRMGCKRVLLSNDYYPALRRPNVDLITSAVAAVTETGVETADGRTYSADVLIFGTGFRAQEYLVPAKFFGRDGVELGDLWRDRPQAYLGINVAGFPNLHLLVGPNTGLGHNSMVFMIESQIRYVMSALRVMKRRRLAAMEIRRPVQAAYNARLQQRLGRTVWSTGCRSWYLDERGNNTTLWPGFTFAYRYLTRRVRVGRYDVRPAARRSDDGERSRPVRGEPVG